MMREAPRASRRAVAPDRSGSAQFEEGRLHDVATRGCHLGSDITDSLIGALNARAVSKYDETGHTWIREGASAEPSCFCGK